MPRLALDLLRSQGGLEFAALLTQLPKQLGRDSRLCHQARLSPGSFFLLFLFCFMQGLTRHSLALPGTHSVEEAGCCLQSAGTKGRCHHAWQAPLHPTGSLLPLSSCQSWFSSSTSTLPTALLESMGKPQESFSLLYFRSIALPAHPAQIATRFLLLLALNHHRPV